MEEENNKILTPTEKLIYILHTLENNCENNKRQKELNILKKKLILENEHKIKTTEK